MRSQAICAHIPLLQRTLRVRAAAFARSRAINVHVVDAVIIILVVYVRVDMVMRSSDDVGTNYTAFVEQSARSFFL